MRCCDLMQQATLEADNGLQSLGLYATGCCACKRESQWNSVMAVGASLRGSWVQGLAARLPLSLLQQVSARQGTFPVSFLSQGDYSSEAETNLGAFKVAYAYQGRPERSHLSNSETRAYLNITTVWLSCVR